MADVVPVETKKTGEKRRDAGLAVGTAKSVADRSLARQETAKDRATLSYLERSTARLETRVPGSSGAKPKTLLKEQSTVAFRQKDYEPAHDRIWNVPEPTGLPRQKPKKMYDQNAAAITRSLASREKARAVREKGSPSDNAKLLIALVLLVGIGIGLYFSVPEVTRIGRVTVRGMTSVSEKEIVDALELSPAVNLVNADIPSMEARILLNPKIADARVGRAFPDRLVVDLKERKAVACVLVAEEIGTKSIAIDEEGVAFAYMDSIATDRKLPVLSGIRFENFTPGQRLPTYLTPLLHDIAELSKESPSVLDAFSEIKIEKISDSEAELVLFPSGKTIPIRMPLRLTKANLGSALLVLDILADRQGAEKIQEIDFRTGTIVYRTKEAQPG